MENRAKKTMETLENQDEGSYSVHVNMENQMFADLKSESNIKHERKESSKLGTMRMESSRQDNSR